MERYVAIDNVCAWPVIVRLPKGEVAAALFNQPTHGGWEGEVECWRSADDGRTWRPAGIPAPHEPGAARMNHAFGLAGNGDLVALVGGHPERPPRGQGEELTFAADPLLAVVCRSADGGRTWRRSGLLNALSDGDIPIPFGRIARRADGRLFVSCYTVAPRASGRAGAGAALLYASDDDGATWVPFSTIAADGYNETAVHFVTATRCVAAARTYADQTMRLFLSDDGGASWRLQGPLSGSFEHNGDLLSLPDGRLLLTYGVRRPGCLGLAVRVSTDAGETWKRSHHVITIDDREHYDAGYPSSLLVGDDHILTAFYAKRVPCHQRYHMGTIIWNWREEFDHYYDR